MKKVKNTFDVIIIILISVIIIRSIITIRFNNKLSADIDIASEIANSLIDEFMNVESILDFYISDFEDTVIIQKFYDQDFNLLGDDYYDYAKYILNFYIHSRIEVPGYIFNESDDVVGYVFNIRADMERVERDGDIIILVSFASKRYFRGSL